MYASAVSFQQTVGHAKPLEKHERVVNKCKKDCFAARQLGYKCKEIV